MKIHEGYKQTEVGMIPEDWEVKSIDEVFDFYSTANYSKAQMHLENEVGCLHYGLIHAIPNSYYDLRNGIKYFITQQQAKYEYLKDGDIVMVDASEDLTGVNKSVEIHGIDSKKFISGLHTFLLRDRGYFTSYIRGAILNSEIVKNQMLRLAVGMKVFGVSKPQLKTVLIPIPTLIEQTAIANALSDMDALIAQTEKLIEKKKAIKHGVMQELLKPKEGWVTKKLGEVCDLKNGYAFKSETYSDSGVYNIVTISNVQDGFLSTDDFAKIEFPPNDLQHHQFLQKQDILVSMTGNVGRLCRVTIENGLLNQRVGKLLPLDIHPGFLYYFLQNSDFKKTMILNSVGGAQGNIGKSTILDYSICFPRKPEEQVSLYFMAEDIYAAIHSLETKLQKLKLQKQGMMQALLTGKIRLV